MTSGSDPLIKIELLVQTAQPQLLEGLESWLRLGLISDQQVRQLCQQYLTCAVELAPLPVLTTIPDLVDDFVTDAPAVAAAPRQIPAPPQSVRAPRAASPDWLSRRLQSLAAEISVIWLLVLGVFMVVVSSGVLAASQWRNFPPAGQYGILFAYTLAFWGAGVWTGRQPNLRLTARMLQITTLLIIPVNFWMMDGFKLWQSGLGWGMAAIAALTLTGLNVNLLQPAQPSRTTLANSIGLSWLHWGWALPAMPLIATYLGTIGTALVLWLQKPESPAEPETARPRDLPLNVVAIAFATLLLIGRAILVARVPVDQLGLAFARGWLLCWLSRRQNRRSFLPAIGSGLLLLGWAVSALAEPPWQAIAVSGLGLWLLADHLRRTWQPSTLTAIFLVGLQATWLVGRLIPPGTRQVLLDRITELAGTTGLPQAIFGVTVLPYVGLTLGVAGWLRRRQRSALADYAEGMALILGLVLAYLSGPNPSLRSLNLLISTGLLAIVTWNRPRPSLVYLTHLVGVGAIASCLYSLFPTMDSATWAIVLLTGTVLEWLAMLVPSLGLPWQQSAWYLGLVLATLSYVLFLGQLPTLDRGWLWLAVPLALTGLATRPNLPQSRWAAWFSLWALLLVQPLTLGFTGPRLVGLGLATALMLVNTAELRHLAAASFTVGFGLSFLAAGTWQIWGERLTGQQLFVLPAIAIFCLWGLRDGCRRRESGLAHLYTQASDGWAIGLSTAYLLILTMVQVAAWNQTTTDWWDPQFLTQFWEMLPAAGGMVAAIAYRFWQQPTNLGGYALAYAGQILAASLVLLLGGSLNLLGMITLALGLAIQILGDVWVRRTGRDYAPAWHGVPLLYAAGGILLQHAGFTAYTGLYTLAGALTGIGVGRRHPQLRSFTYLSLLLMSGAAYELLIYQLAQAKGGEVGDGVVLLGALAGAIALLYRLGDRWLLSYLHLGERALKTIANLHWGAGSALLGMTFLFPRSATGANLWVAVTLLLGIYALILGNQRWNNVASAHSTWTYVGLIEATLALSHGLYLLQPQADFFGAWWAAIACPIALVMYSLPWDAWGWSVQPWRRFAAFLPGLLAALTTLSIALPALLLIAAFYAWLARVSDRLRLSYLSLLFADWAILRFFVQQDLREPLWYVVVLTATLLYVAQIDPALRQQSARDQRHLLRSLATGLLCLTALYQSEIGSRDLTLGFGLLTIGLSMGLILLGLSLRVRAFLYVGTVTFIFKVLRQLWVFVADYSLLLWAIGIVLGLAFIWIAATFEARRSQVTALVQYWMTELDIWD